MTIAFSDLDGTLIGSPRMARAWGGTRQPLVEVERIDDRPAAHLTEAAAQAVREMNSQALLVPVTTRTPAQYRRIRLPGPTPPVALCANGAVLLLGGREDPVHADRVRQGMAGLLASPTQVAARITADHGHVLGNARVHVADGWFTYVVFDSVEEVRRHQHLVGRVAEQVGWSFSVQGRKCYLVPPMLSKGRAVALVAERLGWDRFVAAGDALLDLDMLHRAAEAIVPAHSEMLEPHNIGPHPLPPGTAVTGTKGLDGTAEIAAWLRARVGGPGPS